MMRELPVPEETRIKCRELLAVYEAVEAGKEEHRALEAIHFEQDDRADEFIRLPSSWLRSRRASIASTRPTMSRTAQRKGVRNERPQSNTRAAS